MNMLKIPRERYQAALYDQVEIGLPPLSIGELLEDENLVAVVNGGFFSEEHLPVGLYVLNNNIVINLGTDFNLDLFDRIVLQDDNEVCDVMDVDWVSSDFTLVEEEDYENYYVPIERNPTPSNIAQPVTTQPTEHSQPNNVNQESEKSENPTSPILDSQISTSTEVAGQVSTSTVSTEKEPWFVRLWKFIFGE